MDIFFFGYLFEAYSLDSTSKDHMKYETFKCNFLEILEHFVIDNFLIWTWLPQITLYSKSLNKSYLARLKNYKDQSALAYCEISNVYPKHIHLPGYDMKLLWNGSKAASIQRNKSDEYFKRLILIFLWKSTYFSIH